MVTETAAGYWQGLGFREPPFEETMQYAMYYPIGQWQQLLNYLHTIDPTSYPLATVLGILGSGKSMLAAQFLAQQEDQAASQLLKANNTLRPAALLTEIANVFAIKENISMLSINEQMDAIITHLRERHQNHTLLIDDAHRLPLETLSTLLTLANLQLTEGPLTLQVLLLAEPQLQQRIDNLLDAADLDVKALHFDLPALSFEETKAYLQHRLHKAGVESEATFFNADQLRRIHDLSAGIPGRINRVARQALLDNTRNAPQQQIAKASSKRNSKTVAALLAAHQIKIISVILLVIIGYLLWQYQHQINYMFSANQVANDTAPKLAPVNVSPPTIEQPKHTELATTVQPLANETQQQVVTPPVPASTPTTTDSPTIPPQQQAQAPQTIASTPSTQQLIAAPAQPTEQTVITKPVTTPTADVATDVDHSSVLTDSTLAHMQQQLLTMQGYSLQLLGLRDLTDLQQFIKQQHLQDKALILEATFQHKPWYTLLYGHYATRAEAKQAIASLPENLRMHQPWARSLTSVHQAIQEQKAGSGQTH